MRQFVFFAALGIFVASSGAQAAQIAVSANAPERWLWAEIRAFEICGDPVCGEDVIAVTAGKLPSVSVSGFVDTDTLTAHLDLTIGSIWNFGPLPNSISWNAGTWSRIHGIDPPGFEPPSTFVDGPYDYDIVFDTAGPQIVSTSRVLHSTFALTPTITGAMGTSVVPGLGVVFDTSFDAQVNGASVGPVRLESPATQGLVDLLAATVTCNQGPPITCSADINTSGASLPRQTVITRFLAQRSFAVFGSPPPNTVSSRNVSSGSFDIMSYVDARIFPAPIPEPKIVVLLSLFLVRLVFRAKSRGGGGGSGLTVPRQQGVFGRNG